MNSKIKKYSNFFFYLKRIGFDVNLISSWINYPRFIMEYQKFKRMGGEITRAYPILTDFNSQAGSASGHYFHQDLLVAQFIHASNPMRHIDVGSRIDGFVSHVASFRKIEVLDVRDLQNAGHENISFVKANLMLSDQSQSSITDSISCLHAIEHFGLGRYGDPIDPDGHIKGFNNILKMLKPGGYLYISLPIANASEIQFNAHRIFHRNDIFRWPKKTESVKLKRFDYIDDAGNLHKNVDINKENISTQFGCGIYTFKKISD